MSKQLNTVDTYPLAYRPPLRFRIERKIAWLKLWHHAWRANPRHPFKARREIKAAADEMRRVIQRQFWFGS